VNRQSTSLPKRLLIIIVLVLLLLLAVGLNQYELLSNYLLTLINELKTGR